MAEPTADGRTAPLGDLRGAGEAQRTEAIGTWLAAGENLAEKAVAALDTGDDAKADGLVGRIVALPVIEEGTHAGLMAMSLVLYQQVLDPGADDDAAGGLLDLPLRLLPSLDEAAADELRRVLASLAEYDLPAAVLRRIRDVVPLERRFDPPFARVPEAALPDAVRSVLRLVLRMRSEAA